jgi:hypothetical protein
MIDDVASQRLGLGLIHTCEDKFKSFLSRICLSRTTAYLPFKMSKFKLIKNMRKKSAVAYANRPRKSVGSNRSSLPAQGLVLTQQNNPYLNRGPFPPQIFTKHRYVETVTLTTGTGGILGTAQTFRLNSLYDPNLSGSGHQPYGYDEASTIYGRYCVTNVEASITVSSSTDSNNVVCYTISPAGFTPSVAGSSINDMMETAGGNAIFSNVSGTNHVTARLGNISLAAVEGRTKQGILEERDYGGDYTSNPVISPILSIAAGSLSGVSSATVIVTTTLVYHCRWNHRRPHPGS